MHIRFVCDYLINLNAYIMRLAAHPCIEPLNSYSKLLSDIWFIYSS